MPTPSDDAPALALIEQQAGRWRHGGCDFGTPEVFAAFSQWLRADPRHRDAFIRVSLSRQPKGVLPQAWKAESPGESRVEAVRARPARRFGFAVVSVLLVAAGGVWFLRANG